MYVLVYFLLTIITREMAFTPFSIYLIHYYLHWVSDFFAYRKTRRTTNIIQ